MCARQVTLGQMFRCHANRAGQALAHIEVIMFVKIVSLLTPKLAMQKPVLRQNAKQVII
jgi:hypothetical protein